jgi:hypothetical protein
MNHPLFRKSANLLHTLLTQTPVKWLMICQGTDGLSRGDNTTGVMAGHPMISFVPLHLEAVHRSPQLVPWLQSWLPLCDIRPLLPENWFEAGHGLSGGTLRSDGMWEPHESKVQWFLWTPPPAAASATLDELSISRQKRPHLNHVFVCPRLMTSMWRKKLFKVSDAVLELPAGFHPEWPSTMHEPLFAWSNTLLHSTPPLATQKLSSSFGPGAGGVKVVERSERRCPASSAPTL